MSWCYRRLLRPALFTQDSESIHDRTIAALAKKVATGQLAPSDITQEMISAHLDTHDLPDPDLVIRTSGETRTSNFLPWQAAYAEYEFSEILWPDFTPEILTDIMSRFGNRERRYGGVVTK